MPAGETQKVKLNGTDFFEVLPLAQRRSAWHLAILTLTLQERGTFGWHLVAENLFALRVLWQHWLSVCLAGLGLVNCCELE